MTEEWRAVIGHEGSYEVSNLGRVRSVSRLISFNVTRHGKTFASGRTVTAKILKPYRRPDGYEQFTWPVEKRPKNFLVHILVGKAFLGPRPDGMMVLHGPLGQQVNAASNLRYGTGKDNSADRISFGVPMWGEFCAHHKLTIEQVMEVRASPDSSSALAAKMGVSATAIYLIRKKKNWRLLEEAA